MVTSQGCGRKQRIICSRVFLVRGHVFQYVYSPFRNSLAHVRFNDNMCYLLVSLQPSRMYLYICNPLVSKWILKSPSSIFVCDVLRRIVGCPRSVVCVPRQILERHVFVCFEHEQVSQWVHPTRTRIPLCFKDNKNHPHILLQPLRSVALNPWSFELLRCFSLWPRNSPFL